MIRPGRHRAVDAEDKLQRKQEVLDTAEQLYRREQQMPSMDELAKSLGLAKGTVYLYFPTKEALYLALHERQISRFFEALQYRLDAPKNFGFEDFLEPICTYLLDDPNFLPLCLACMRSALHAEDGLAHEQFHQKLAHMLGQAGASLERHLPLCRPGDGVRILYHGYGSILGLYHLLGPAQQNCQHMMEMNLLPALGDFRSESIAALQSQWQNMLSKGLSPLPSSSLEAQK
jgi:AcrR family transcriptional regulator